MQLDAVDYRYTFVFARMDENGKKITKCLQVHLTKCIFPAGNVSIGSYTHAILQIANNLTKVLIRFLNTIFKKWLLVLTTTAMMIKTFKKKENWSYPMLL